MKLNRKLILAIIVLLLGVIMISINTKVNAASNDASLSSISIEPVGTGLKRDSQNNKIYRAEVENDVTSVTINAVPNNSRAKVNVSGNTELEVGTNKITVQVTAEDGTSEQYLLYVRRKSKTLAETNVIPNVQEEGDVYQDENNANNIVQTTQEDANKENENNEGMESEKNTEIENAINDGNTIENADTNTEESKKQNIGILVFIVIILIAIAIIVASKRKHK